MIITFALQPFPNSSQLGVNLTYDRVERRHSMGSFRPLPRRCQGKAISQFVRAQ